MRNLARRITAASACCLISLLPALANADPTSAIADDGREVRLMPDGSWEYASEDRFATTSDGQRIRLLPDGTWEPVDRADAERLGLTQKGGFARDVIEVDRATLRLDTVEIETAREERHKNTRSTSQMNFFVTVDAMAPVTTRSIEPNAFAVTDSRGREYEPVAVTPGGLELDAGESRVVRVTVADSPAWWGVKFFMLQIAPETLGNAGEVTLTKHRDQVTELEVDELSVP